MTRRQLDHDILELTMAVADSTFLNTMEPVVFASYQLLEACPFGWSTLQLGFPMLGSLTEVRERRYSIIPTTHHIGHMTTVQALKKQVRVWLHCRGFR
jgi:hypothetical protein